MFCRSDAVEVSTEGTGGPTTIISWHRLSSEHKEVARVLPQFLNTISNPGLQRDWHPCGRDRGALNEFNWCSWPSFYVNACFYSAPPEVVSQALSPFPDSMTQVCYASLPFGMLCQATRRLFPPLRLFQCAGMQAEGGQYFAGTQCDCAWRLGAPPRPVHTKSWGAHQPLPAQGQACPSFPTEAAFTKPPIRLRTITHPGRHSRGCWCVAGQT